MKVQSSEKVDRRPVEMEGAVGCSVRWLVSRDDGAPNFAMRQFEIEPGGYTPHHHHPYEHEVYVLEGSGEVIDGDTPRPISAGDVILVQPNDVHQFRNTGDKPMKFLCLIPNSADNRPGSARPECSAVSPQQ